MEQEDTGPLLLRFEDRDCYLRKRVNGLATAKSGFKKRF